MSFLRLRFGALMKLMSVLHGEIHVYVEIYIVHVPYRLQML